LPKLLEGRVHLFLDLGTSLGAYRSGAPVRPVDVLPVFFVLPCVVWISRGPLPRWVPGPTTRWALGTTRLVPHGTWWREAQGLRWSSTRIGSYTYHVLCRGLLDVHD
jgi:hypothetical protein